jgi:flagellar FliJ protein
VEKKRQHLLQASKNRKIIEKLEEQQNAAYKKHLDKLEAGMLDEIAVLSHEHKKSD